MDFRFYFVSRNFICCLHSYNKHSLCDSSALARFEYIECKRTTERRNERGAKYKNKALQFYFIFFVTLLKFPNSVETLMSLLNILQMECLKVFRCRQYLFVINRWRLTFIIIIKVLWNFQAFWVWPHCLLNQTENTLMMDNNRRSSARPFFYTSTYIQFSGFKSNSFSFPIRQINSVQTEAHRGVIECSSIRIVVCSL